MHLMLRQDRPANYVVGTGRIHSVRELVELAFGTLGLRWSDHVVTDSALVRPAEPDVLCADATRAREQLGWEPRVTFEELIHTMIEADLDRLTRSRHRELCG